MDTKLLKAMAWVYAAAFALLATVAVAACRADEVAKFEPSDQQILLHAEAQRHRIANGRDAQELDAELCRICQSHAERMAASRSMFHGGQDNCVCYGPTTAVGAIGMWLGSPPHRAFLMSGTKKAGWGAAQAKGGAWYYAAAFRGSTVTSSTSQYSKAIGRRFRIRR